MQYVIEMAIAVGVAFAVSFIMYKDQKPKAETAGIEAKASAAAGAAAAETAGAEKETGAAANAEEAAAQIPEETVKSPVRGRILPLSSPFRK